MPDSPMSRSGVSRERLERGLLGLRSNWHGIPHGWLVEAYVTGLIEIDEFEKYVLEACCV